MKPPKKIRVGPCDWDVVLKDEFLDDDDDIQLGAATISDLEIGIRKDINKQIEQETLMHEVLHAVFAQSGVDLSHNKEERVVAAISPYLLMLLRDNPKLYKYLCQNSS